MENRDGKLVVYKSSAGSGKTYTLVKEYVNILLKNPDDYRRVLAITFTNKAANEMKERIISELIKLSATNAAADKALKLIIHNYSEFSVSTIDHFVQRISRIFARDLNLSVNYEVELDEDAIIRKIVDVLMSKVGHDKDLTTVMLSYVKSRIDDERNWRIEDEIMSMGRSVFRDDSVRFMARLRDLNLGFDDFIAIRKRLVAVNDDIVKQVKEIAQRACDYIENQGLTATDFYQGKRGIGGYFEKLKRTGSVEEAHAPNSYVWKAVNEGVWTNKGNEGNGVMLIADRLKMCFEELQQTNLEGYLVNGHIIRNLYGVSLLNEIRALLDDYIADNDLVPISEFNRKINDIILNEPVPYIYARVGERFKHVFVDEFQDTSKLQWHNLIPLFDNALSYSNFNMIIGDAKQSIYRWRGGEVEQFVGLPEVDSDCVGLGDAGRRFADDYNPKVLEYNYRSRSVVVEFNNLLYDFVKDRLANNEQLGRIYESQSQRQPETNAKEGGYVSVKFFEKLKGAERVEAYLTETAQIIKRCVSQGYRYKDIAVLCRSNVDNLRLAAYLSELGVPVVSRESLLLATNVRVRLMISLLSYVANPYSRFYEYEIILMLLAIDENIEREPILRAIVNKGFNFREVMSRMGYEISIDELSRMSLYDAGEEIVRRLSFDSGSDPYITTLLSMILESGNSKMGGSIGQFLSWWNDNKEKLSLNMPDDMDGVKLLTIHKSKGLQFPVVIYPFANEKLVRIDADKWVDLKADEQQSLTVMRGTLKEELRSTYLRNYLEIEESKSMIDSVNLLYVATTRAEDRLYVLADFNEKDEVSDINGLMYRFLKFRCNVEGRECEFGCESEVETKVEQEYDDADRRFISTDWKEMLYVHLVSNESSDEPDEKRDWGTLIHSLLAQVFTEDDIDVVLNKAVKDGTITDVNRLDVELTLREVVCNSEISKYFLPGLKVRNECRLLLPDGNVLIPDRMVFEDDGVSIIDYKTGVINDNDQYQVDRYGDVIQMMGYAVKDKIVYYINS